MAFSGPEPKKPAKEPGWFEKLIDFFHLEKLLPAAKAQALEPQLRKVLVDFFNRADRQAKRRYSTLYNGFLPLDSEEADTLTRFLLNRAQRSVYFATLVFYLLDMSDWIVTGDILGSRMSLLSQLEGQRRKAAKGGS